MREATLRIPRRAGAGQTGVHPRALEVVSERSLDLLAGFFGRREAMLIWPGHRLLHIMVRIPKEGGGARLIGLMPTLLRV